MEQAGAAGVELKACGSLGYKSFTIEYHQGLDTGPCFRWPSHPCECVFEWLSRETNRDL